MISVIIPAYNEAGNIKMIAQRVLEQLRNIESFEIIFVDDGSTDATLEEIREIIKNMDNIKLISLSRNFGHQNALKAGLDYSAGDCVISMDADLQHPPELLCQLINKWKEGYDVVYTIRKDTHGISWMKKVTSKIFYKIINRLSDVEIPLGAADFRLLDRKVVNELKKMDEKWLFIRGLISWLGFKQIGIEYTAQPRHIGNSKYSIAKMMAFAIQGITSFSILPLRVSLLFGGIISFIAFLYAIYALYIKFFTNIAITGWTSLLISVLFLGGIQLFVLGIIGEYLGKMFIEGKSRPNYVIKEKKI